MQGQEKLTTLLNSLPITKFPHSLILNGDKGCGKHTLLQEIAEKYKLEVVDITGKLTLDFISEVQESPFSGIYSINADKISIKEQNIILKFLEEPSTSVYIIILCENVNNLLTTVKNRCETWVFSQYAKDFLNRYIVNTTNKETAENLLKIARTPGQVKLLDSTDIDTYLSLTDKIFDKCGVASISNLLTISNKLGFKGEKEKLDFDIFKMCLLFSAERYVEKTSRYDIYVVCHDFIKRVSTAYIDKKQCFENFLLSLKVHMNEN